MHDYALEALTVLFVASATALLLIYCLGVTRVLKQNLERFDFHIPGWQVFKRFHLYREIRSARGDSLSTYYIAIILAWFAVLLAAVIILKILWERTHADF